MEKIDLAENKIVTNRWPFISIIIPVYNEKDNLLVFVDNLKNNLEKINCQFEFIFVNDGSKDESGKILKELSEADKRIKVIEFSRNFGKEMAVTAGINFCHGDACILIDADMQHPIELIPDFLKKWEDGADVVIGVKIRNYRLSIFKFLCSFLFYKIINYGSDTKIIPFSTDYRLLDRIVINEFNKLSERNRMVRGLISWLGFKREFITFEPKKRVRSESKFGFLKLLKLAISAYISHSLLPLKVAGYLGIFIILSSGSFGLFILVSQYFLHLPNISFSGPEQLTVIFLFLSGVILSCLGLIALYIGNINTEVINRPLYIIRKKINFDDQI